MRSLSMTSNPTALCCRREEELPLPIMYLVAHVSSFLHRTAAVKRRNRRRQEEELPLPIMYLFAFLHRTTAANNVSSHLSLQNCHC